jgi:ribosomal protein S6--L-glutamate ligase
VTIRSVKIGLLAWDNIGTDPDEPAFTDMGKNRGHEMHQFSLEDITYVPRPGGGFGLLLAAEPAESFDAVFSRAKLYGGDWQDRVERLTLLSQVLGTRLHSPADAWVRGYSKFQCAQWLAGAGLPVLPVRSATTLAEIELACREWGTIIVKPSFEYAAAGVERVTDPSDPAQAKLVADLLARYATLGCTPYVPTEYGEYRLTIGGESCVTAFKIPPVGMWRCKSREGATFERVNPPRELLDMAIRATRLMGLTMAGVDALPARDGYVILEVNPVPGILDMFGADARRETFEGVYDWIETHA